MPISFANRYAKSLIDLSTELNIADKVFLDMNVIFQSITDSTELTIFCKSPIITTDKKISIFKEIFGKRLHKETMNLINLTTKKNREPYLKDIALQYIIQYRAQKNIIKATITTVGNITDNLVEDLKKIIRAHSPCNHIEIETKIDEQIIGGYILQFGDFQLDNSVKTALYKLYDQFDDNDFLKKI